ncbi:MAG: S9 family peptidase, partial [Gammaproteobacteria bacterium]
MTRKFVCLALSWCIASTTFAEPFTAEQLVRIDRVGAPAVSPGGDLIVYAVRHADMEADKGRYDLWLSTTAGAAPRRLTTHEANDTSPAWSPDGRHILFLSSRGGSNQVWRLPVGGGEAQPVTDLPIDVGTFRLSPRGDQLVVSVSVYLDCDDLQCSADRAAQTSDNKVTAQRYDRLFMRHWDHWLDDRRSQLFAIALDDNGEATRTPVRLSRVDADVPSRVWGGNEEYAISPDGKTLYFTARLRDRDEPTSTNYDIYSVPMDGKGKVENLTATNKAWDTAPVVSPDGRYLAWLAMSRPGFEADQFQVVLRDLRTGKARVLTENWDRSPSSIIFARDGKSIFLNAQDVGHKTLWELGLDGNEPVKLVSRGTVSAFDDGGNHIVYAMNSLTSPDELYVFDPDTGDSRRITDFGARTLAGVTMGEFEQFSFEGADGDTVYGFVVKPPGAERGKKYPVAFLIH